MFSQYFSVEKREIPHPKFPLSNRRWGVNTRERLLKPSWQLTRRESWHLFSSPVYVKLGNIQKLDRDEKKRKYGKVVVR